MLKRRERKTTRSTAQSRSQSIGRSTSRSNFNTVPNAITMRIPLGSRFGTRLDQKNLFIFFKVWSGRLEAQKSSDRVVDLILTKTQST